MAPLGIFTHVTKSPLPIIIRLQLKPVIVNPDNHAETNEAKRWRTSAKLGITFLEVSTTYTVAKN